MSQDGHYYCPDQPPRAPGVFKNVIRCVSIVLGPHSSSYLRAVRQSISLILDLIALLPSPTSPSTEAQSATPILYIAKMDMRRYVCIAIFRFPFVNLAHTTSRLLIAFRRIPIHSELSTEDDGTNQVVEHVNYVHKTSNS